MVFRSLFTVRDKVDVFLHSITAFKICVQYVLVHLLKYWRRIQLQGQDVTF